MKLDGGDGRRVNGNGTHVPTDRPAPWAMKEAVKAREKEERKQDQKHQKQQHQKQQQKQQQDENAPTKAVAKSDVAEKRDSTDKGEAGRAEGKGKTAAGAAPKAAEGRGGKMAESPGAGGARPPRRLCASAGTSREPSPSAPGGRRGLQALAPRKGHRGGGGGGGGVSSLPSSNRSSHRSSSMVEPRKMPSGQKGGGDQKPPYPWDMESLKEAIVAAEPGKGEVKTLIVKSLFSPRAPAFTALINMCGKEKMAAKAIEVFETSRELKIEKNTYMYSALISALGSSGQWEQAFAFFEKMLQEKSEMCKPNTITYSALISACERAGQVAKALEVFQRMKAAGIAPDLITYSVLLSACEKESLWDEAINILDQMHASNLHANPMNYSRVINALGETGNVDKAVEIFLQMQLAGCEISLNLCNLMLNCLERNKRGDLAYHLIISMHNNGIIGESITYNMVLSALGESPDPSVLQCMLEIYNTMKYFSVRVTAYTCSQLIKACHKFGDPHTALRLTHDFQALNVALDQPTLQLLNQLLRTNPGPF